VLTFSFAAISNSLWKMLVNSVVFAFATILTSFQPYQIGKTAVVSEIFVVGLLFIGMLVPESFFIQGATLRYATKSTTRRQSGSLFGKPTGREHMALDLP